MSFNSKPKTIAAAALVASAALWTGCNTNPVTFESQEGVLNYEETVNVSGSEQIDLLWVIDNSGSMCQEQEILGSNFDAFIGELEDTTLDFHIAVTTTHMREGQSNEPVARPGRLQSTPQPIVGFDDTCKNAVDENGEPIPGNFQPIRDAIATAVGCAEGLDLADFNWSDSEIECVANNRMGCTLNGQQCEGGTRDCVTEDLFPDPSTYRDIPLVLKSEDYRTQGGALDTERLRADFRCMSLVGTRGYGIEKGLEAAVETVSLDKTGGPADLEEGATTEVNLEAPNHGFLRQNSKFGLIFVTDENDCSHNGNLDEQTSCGGAVCEFYNSTRLEPSETPLFDTNEMKTALLENLRQSKANPEFAESEVLVASIHGRSVRYDGEVKGNAECMAEGYTPPPPACASALGQAYSGDRYERFIREFPNFYPQPDQNDIVQGWMCSETFTPALQAIGEFIKPLPTGCVQRNVFPCDGDNTSCPAFPNGEAGVCSPVFNRDGIFFCESGVQVRAQLTNPTPAERERLESSGWCVDGTFDTRSYPNGCIISREFYTWSECAPGVGGIRLQWNDETTALRTLSGTEIGIRYAATVE